MPNKPDKFGLKFSVLAEVKLKYVCNLFPYLGALEEIALEENQRNENILAEYVVIRLTDCLQTNGAYNFTTDNVF